MKRLVLLFIVSFIICASIFAGPFGLKMGMTLEDVAEVCNGERPIRIENDDRYYIKPTKSHLRFKIYIAWISDEYGLYAIRGISDDIYTDKYGKELKNAFYSFYDRVSAIYGNGKTSDGLINNDIIKYKKGDDYWTETLKEGDRVLYAEWGVFQRDVKMKDDLVYIRLWTSASGYLNFEGRLFIDYQFSNIVQVQNKEDDVL